MVVIGKRLDFKTGWRKRYRILHDVESFTDLSEPGALFLALTLKTGLAVLRRLRTKGNERAEAKPGAVSLRVVGRSARIDFIEVAGIIGRRGVLRDNVLLAQRSSLAINVKTIDDILNGDGGTDDGLVFDSVAVDGDDSLDLQQSLLNLTLGLIRVKSSDKDSVGVDGGAFRKKRGGTRSRGGGRTSRLGSRLSGADFLISRVFLVERLSRCGKRVGIGLQVGVSSNGDLLLLESSSHHELLQSLKKRSLLGHNGTVVNIEGEEVDNLKREGRVARKLSR